MGYLQLQGGVLPPFNKAIISLWFIIEQDAVDASRAAGDEWDAANATETDPILPPLYRVIPLITFGAARGTYNTHFRTDTGPRGTATWQEVNLVVTGPPGCSQMLTPQGTINLPYGANYVAGKAHPIDPCYIGVYVPGLDAFDEDDPDSLTPKLALRIQYGDVPTIAWLSASIGNLTTSGTRYQYSGLYGAECGLPSVVTSNGKTKYIPRGTFDVSTTYRDDSETWYDWQQGRESIGARSRINIEPEKWHHLLLSFDFSGEIHAAARATPLAPAVASSTCKLWVALDDENYTGNDLPAMWVSASGLAPDGDPNAVITSQAQWAAFQIPNPARGPTLVDHGGYVAREIYGAAGPARYDWTPSAIPDGAMGIPATSDIVDEVRHCDMAELQMWLGRSLDTGDVNNRRAFVDYVRDENGEIIADEDGSTTKKPVKPATAEDLEVDGVPLGRPHILLHTTKRWQQGKNTGSLGTTRNPDGTEEPIPAGQFEPTGTIKKYVPDPSLEAS